MQNPVEKCLLSLILGIFHLQTKRQPNQESLLRAPPAWVFSVSFGLGPCERKSTNFVSRDSWAIVVWTESAKKFSTLIKHGFNFLLILSLLNNFHANLVYESLNVVDFQLLKKKSLQSVSYGRKLLKLCFLPRNWQLLSFLSFVSELLGSYCHWIVDQSYGKFPTGECYAVSTFHIGFSNDGTVTGRRRT